MALAWVARWRLSGAEIVNAGVWATALVGVVGIAAGYATARGQRKHTETLAREERAQARRGEAYVEALTAVRHYTTSIARSTYLITTPGAQPPPPSLDDATTFRLDAVLAAFGSTEVRDMLKSWSDACSVFYENRSRAPDPGQPGYPTKA